MAYEQYCAACTYLNERYWCEKKGEKHNGNDPKCNSFCEAYSRSNSARANLYETEQSSCYLTTMMCKILNYPDDNYYLNTLRKFRDDVMKTNPKYFPLLLTYDQIGPMISYELQRDKDNKVIAMTFFNNYITKSVSAIEEEKYDTAINIYKAMTDALAEKYHIDTRIVIPKMDTIDINTLGHARVRKMISNNN